jgi:hypothetical protein
VEYITGIGKLRKVSTLFESRNFKEMRERYGEREDNIKMDLRETQYKELN